jgi:streptogramin lyase
MRAVLVLAALALAALALATRADGFIYWAMYYEGNIGRANLDGTNSDRGFIRGLPGVRSVAVDSHHVYWAATDGIGRAKLDGSRVEEEFVPLGRVPAAGAFDVAVTAEHLYWVRTDRSWISRASIDGSDVEKHFMYVEEPWEIAADDSHIYWTDFATDSIGRANLDGTEVVQLIPGSGATGIAVGADHLYWVKNYGGVARSDLDGGGVEPRLIAGRPDYGLAVDADHIYWDEPFFGGLSAGHGISRIGRANLDGSAIEKDFLTHVGVVQGMTVDGLYRRDTKRPQTQIKTPKTTAKRNTAFRFASSEPVSRTFDCKLDKERWKP